jgi:thiamine pyrophosphate-dependent acetolactate synthase large subunit-like protein
MFPRLAGSDFSPTRDALHASARLRAQRPAQIALHNPRFPAQTRLGGARGTRVTRPDQLTAALAEALAHDGPALVEIMADVDLI